MPPAINSKHIDHREYSAILNRLRELGRSNAAIEQVASEFNRGVSTIVKLAPRAR